MSDQPIGSRMTVTDEFIRSAAIITEVREGEFDMHGQTWRYVCRTTTPDGQPGAAVYERVR